MKEDEGNARETVAHRTAIEAYAEAYVKGLKGLPLNVLKGTSHEHVVVMQLSDGLGLECRVHISFGNEIMSAQMVKGFETVRGLDLDKLMRRPPRA